MIPINNSDLAWLVTADYYQDNNVLGAEELREDIYNPEIEEWYYESPYTGPNIASVGGTVGSFVGSEVGVDKPVGCATLVGGIVGSEFVGGNEW